MSSYAAHLAAAEALLRLDEAGAARGWLADATQVPRGWEWRWLESRADQSRRSLQAHPGSVAFGLRRSADGSVLASSGYDNVARLWNALSGDLLATLEGHTAGLWAAVPFPDGSRVVSAAHELVIWDVSTRRPLLSRRPHLTGIYAARFSPDGNTLASLGHDGFIHLHRAER